MNPAILIDHSHNFSGLFYTGSYLVMFAILIYGGIRRKYRLYPYLVILFTMSVFAIIGGKLMSYSLTDWKYFFSEGSFPLVQRKVLYGYFLFGLAGLVISKNLLRFREDFYDLLAFAAPVRLIIARIGCLTGGCCYGIPTDSSFGISYGKGFPAWAEHLNSGLISADASQSLNVHPTQFYEILACILIIVALWWIWKKRLLRKNFSLLLLTLAFYSTSRFVIEFFRAGVETWQGLSYLQWGIIGLVVIMGFLIVFIEKYYPVKRRDIRSTAEPGPHIIIFSLSVVLIILALLRWLSSLEVMICLLVTLFLLSGAIIHFIRLRKELQYLRVPALMLIASFFLMSQQAEFATDSIPRIKNHVYVGLGGVTGKDFTIGGVAPTFSAGGAELGYTFFDRHQNSHTFSGEVYRINYADELYFGVSPYYEYNTKYLGIGAGFNYSPYTGSLKEYSFFPKIGLKLGVMDCRSGILSCFYFEGKLGNQFPTGMPGMQVGLGCGLNWRSPRYKNYISFGLSEQGFYINPSFNFDNILILDPFLAYGDRETYNIGIRLYYIIPTEK